jgi:predicted type IV restriction endonuclease
LYFSFNIVECLLKARIGKPVETAVARERHGIRHVTAATLTCATIEDLLEAVFYVLSVSRLYNEYQLSLEECTK